MTLTSKFTYCAVSRSNGSIRCLTCRREWSAARRNSASRFSRLQRFLENHEFSLCVLTLSSRCGASLLSARSVTLPRLPNSGAGTAWRGQWLIPLQFFCPPSHPSLVLLWKGLSSFLLNSKAEIDSRQLGVSGVAAPSFMFSTSSG